MPASQRIQQVLTAMMRYCAYRDRCCSEVRERMAREPLSEDERNKVIALLQEQGFLNEQRYASGFVRGKFNQLQWGRIRIRRELGMKGIPDELIDTAMEEIAEEDYLETISRLLLKKCKAAQLKDYAQAAKAMKFVYGKGYESDLIRSELEKLKASGRDG